MPPRPSQCVAPPPPWRRATSWQSMLILLAHPHPHIDLCGPGQAATHHRFSHPVWSTDGRHGPRREDWVFKVFGRGAEGRWAEDTGHVQLGGLNDRVPRWFVLGWMTLVVTLHDVSFSWRFCSKRLSMSEFNHEDKLRTTRIKKVPFLHESQTTKTP